MKTRLLLIITFLISTNYVFSQKSVVINTLREGDLTYVKDSRYIIQSFESTKIIKESYFTICIAGFPRANGMKSIFRTIFSKGRAEELGKFKYSLECIFNFDGIKQQLCFISFDIYKTKKLLLTLDELKRIEEKFKTLKYTYSVEDNTIIPYFTSSYYTLDFEELYLDD